MAMKLCTLTETTNGAWTAYTYRPATAENVATWYREAAISERETVEGVVCPVVAKDCRETERALAEFKKDLAHSLENAAAVEQERDRLSVYRSNAEAELGKLRRILGASSEGGCDPIIASATRVMAELAEARAQLATVTAERDGMRETCRALENRCASLHGQRDEQFLLRVTGQTGPGRLCANCAYHELPMSEEPCTGCVMSAQNRPRWTPRPEAQRAPLPRPEPALHPGSRWDGDAVVNDAGDQTELVKVGEGYSLMTLRHGACARYTPAANVIAVLHRGGLLP